MCYNRGANLRLKGGYTILNISMSDELYAKYGDFGAHRPHMAIVDQLKRYSSLSPYDARVMVISGAERDELEKLTGETIDSGKDLIRVFKLISTLKLDELQITLPVEVRKFYQGQAEFQGQNAGQFLGEKIIEKLRQGAWV